MTENATRESYEGLIQAYEIYNAELFEGRLPGALITLQRQKNTRGYYHPARFNKAEGPQADEIAMHPGYFAVESAEEALSTLVHEMVHQQQQHFGTPGRGGYHNTEWAQMMVQIGLQPSHTARPGGRITGDRVSHYILEGGRYIEVTRQLLDKETLLAWRDRFPPEGVMVEKKPPIYPKNAKPEKHRVPSRAEQIMHQPTQPPPEYVQEGLVWSPMKLAAARKVKTKYVCERCGAAVWGKPGLSLICGTDQGRYVTAEPCTAAQGDANAEAPGIQDDSATSTQIQARTSPSCLAASSSASKAIIGPS